MFLELPFENHYIAQPKKMVDLLVVWILPRFGVIPALPDYLQFWILIVLNALIYLPVTFMTKPENMDHLVAYYAMSRPIGFWSPVRKEAERRGLIPST